MGSMRRRGGRGRTKENADGRLTLKASRTEPGETTALNPTITNASRAAPNPSRTPMVPPSKLNVMASMRNCSRISCGCAPTAMRMPISRVRSVTLTSMMFMMPMPPTSRDMPAIAPSSSVMIVEMEFDGIGDFLLIEDVEIIVAARRSADDAGAAGSVICCCATCPCARRWRSAD